MALLDQAIVAGVGNIYADEALFLSSVHPETLCADLTLAQISRLRANIIQVLETSIEAQGTTFSSFRSVAGTNGNYGNVAWVLCAGWQGLSDLRNRNSAPEDGRSIGAFLSYLPGEK